MGSTQDNTKSTIYFGYGSNLWLHQMELRCPTSKYLGVARLNGYRWIINDRGYANVIQLSNGRSLIPSPAPSHDYYENVVFGLVYSLQPKDEERLDKNEGVPVAYTKEFISDIDFWESEDGKWVDVTKKPTEKSEMLVYIDRKRLSEDVPKDEYVVRMNRGIEDGVKMGIPTEYVERVMRRFIPKEGEERRSMEEKALMQAGTFRDESGVF